MYRTTLKMLIVAATGLVLACGSNANPVAPEVADLGLDSVSANAPGGKPPPAEFTVEVYLDGNLAGTNPVAISNRKETGFDTSDIVLNLTLLNNVDGGSLGCGTFSEDAGTVSGSFGTGTLKRAWAAFFDFKVNGIVHFLDFRSAAIDGDSDWLPADENSMRGTEIDVQVNKGRQKKGGCDASITQDWEFRVIRNAS